MKILHYVPYSILFPPSNGGTLRCYHIAKELSQRHEVDLFLVQDKNQIAGKYLEGFGKVNIYTPLNGNSITTAKWPHAKIINSLKYRYVTGQYFRSADSVFLSLLPVFKKLLGDIEYDAVIFEHLQAMITAPFFRRFLPDSFFILDAHNVDHQLISEEHKEHSIRGFEKRYGEIFRYESSLSKYVDGYWACSSQDATVFAQINRSSLPGAVIPNGVDTSLKQFLTRNEHPGLSLLFCGDLNTVANRTGISWFIDYVWPLVKASIANCGLAIVGSGDDHPDLQKYKLLPGISFKGRVDNLEAAYLDSTISIAPLTVGSGTRLKIMESLSYGIPVIATSKAAEGVKYQDGVHLMIADDPEQFATRILNVAEDRSLYQKLRINGRQFVETNYDWSVIGNKMSEFLQQHKRKR